VADCFNVGAVLKRDARHDRCVSRNRFHCRADLIRRYENLGDLAVREESGAQFEGMPRMAKIASLAAASIRESLAGAHG
jgi:hypothetical protein